MLHDSSAYVRELQTGGLYNTKNIFVIYIWNLSIDLNGRRRARSNLIMVFYKLLVELSLPNALVPNKPSSS